MMNFHEWLLKKEEVEDSVSPFHAREEPKFFLRQFMDYVGPSLTQLTPREKELFLAVAGNQKPIRWMSWIQQDRFSSPQMIQAALADWKQRGIIRSR